jgi:alkylation response protein AidB-like acyl-CoA dehydrogenase
VKLFWATISQRLADTAVGVIGPDAVTPDPIARAGSWSNRLLTTRANSIMGGTSEIQRNVIGERILGLPREPR